jgi:hypothetical protein
MLSKVKLIKVFLRLSAFTPKFLSSDFAGYANTRVDTLSFFGSKACQSAIPFISLNALRNFELAHVEQFTIKMA